MARSLAQRTATAKKNLVKVRDQKKRHDAAGEKLKKETAKAIIAADGLLKKTEVADVLGVHRTTVYELRGEAS